MATPPLDRQAAQRLAFIRYLHHLAVEQTRLPEPMSSASVLMFHDAVESFLVLAGEHLGAPAVPNFMKYWDQLSPAKLENGVNLAVQQGMKRLNDQRNIIKHNGGVASAEAISQIKDDVATFMAANTLSVFGVDYDTVSMASVIPQDAAREAALRADAALAAGDHKMAMVALVDAWAEVYDPRRDPRDSTGHLPPFDFGPKIHWSLREEEIANVLRPDSSQRQMATRYRQVAELIYQLTEIATSLQKATRLTTVGIDFAEYQRFKLLTPTRDDYMNGRRKYRAPVTYSPTRDDVTWCLQFVITAALRLANAEAQVATPPWVEREWHRAASAKWETILEVPTRNG